MSGLGPVWALATVLSTLVGGLAAVRLRRRLTGVMAFTGGVVVGVTLFDIAPEALARLGSAAEGRTLGLAMAAGLVGFLVLSRTLVLPRRDDPDPVRRGRPVGTLGALALSVHSLLDGFGIGAGFALSPQVGALVLVAVVAHDFADGMNTVTFVLSQHQSLARARAWLVVDALAPEVGALAGAAVTLGAHAYAVGLGVYAGIFLMIGTIELLAVAHREPSPTRLALTVAGALLVYLVTGFLPV